MDNDTDGWGDYLMGLIGKIFWFGLIAAIGWVIVVEGAKINQRIPGFLVADPHHCYKVSGVYSIPERWFKDMIDFRYWVTNAT